MLLHIFQLTVPLNCLTVWKIWEILSFYGQYNIGKLILPKNLEDLGERTFKGI